MSYPGVETRNPAHLLEAMLPVPVTLVDTALPRTLLGPRVEISREGIPARQRGARVVPSALEAREEGVGVRGTAVLVPVLAVRGCESAREASEASSRASEPGLKRVKVSRG